MVDISQSYRVAVLIPCFNEEVAIEKVITQFRAALPSAEIYVYDNNSTDNTAQAAVRAGAEVRHETRQGKGHVVRRMFADIEADIYLLVDGDATYDAESAPALVQNLIQNHHDMVVATRVERDKAAYRRGHRTGNMLLTGFLSFVFGRSFTDILSGYRVFSRRFVKSFPALSGGFEIETELSVHALELDLPTGEVATPYFARAEGSTSKLNTWGDGFRILWMMGKLFRAERPLTFFFILGGMLATISVAIALPIIATYLDQGIVPRLPTAILSTGLMVLACLAFAAGLILDTVTQGRREMKRLAYLGIPALDLRQRASNY